MGMATGKPEDSGWYETILQICFCVKGKRLSDIGRVNDLLRDFRKLVESQKIITGSARIRVQSVGEFASQKMDLMTLNFSQQIKLEVVDDETRWAYNRTHHIEPAIHNHFEKLSLSNKSKGDERLEISYVDSSFGGDGNKDHRWPKPDMFRSQI